MTTIRQLIQMTPATANALFAKLVDTKVSALKTRERLFYDLKQELELLANLEEQHLFPVLRKHKQLKKLVREAMNDNTATRKLLAELENTPRNTEEFGVRVAELRKVFQQHVRDEKKELLPAILNALTDEEAKGVVDNIEAETAEVEEAKRAAAEQRRTDARREREKLEAEQERIEKVRRAEDQQRRTIASQREVAEQVQAATETMVGAAMPAPLTAQHTTTAAQDTVPDAVGDTSTMISSAGEQAESPFSAMLQQNQELVAQATRNMQILMGAGNSLAAKFHEISASYSDASQTQLDKNLAGISAVLSSRTLAELFDAQAALFLNHLEVVAASRGRMAEAGGRD
ncbi:MAG: hemerythrin domain-containing protein [Beijerinckiaceae bacterium]|nr:hemerythrin domain-containing protein [Beijerinckiaceae bacterium]